MLHLYIIWCHKIHVMASFNVCMCLYCVVLLSNLCCVILSSNLHNVLYCSITSPPVMYCTTFISESMICSYYVVLCCDMHMCAMMHWVSSEYRIINYNVYNLSDLWDCKSYQHMSLYFILSTQISHCSTHYKQNIKFKY